MIGAATGEVQVAPPARRLAPWPALGAIVLLLVIGIVYADPIGDGDLFWHMMYAKQMLANLTPRVDHTLYSWTPASNAVIYNAWVGEIVLYLLYEGLGLWSLFALRYLIVAGIVAWAWRYAARTGQKGAATTFLLLMLLVIGVAPGALVKPEMFSLLFLNLVVGAYFRARLLRDDPARAIRWLYAVPVVVLVWVNAHGGFILAAPFLAAAALGEAMNRLLAPKAAMSLRVYRHLLLAWALCAVAVMLTPYGPAYPIQLLQDYLFGQRDRPDVAWNLAYQSIFHDGARVWHFVPLLAVLLALVVAQLWRWAIVGPKGQRIDWVTVLATLAYLPLFVAHVRSSYVLPVVAVYSTLYMASLGRDASPAPVPVSRRRRKVSALRRWWLQARPALPRMAAAALMLYFGGRAAHGAWYMPTPSSWLGFGINYGNPVAEAEYLARNRFGPRLYNIFDSGGYLLWRLYPDYKVMVDSRSFPYLAWFDDQYRFTMGENFDDFLRRYVGDTAVIDLAKSAAVRNFMRSNEWRLVYYGPTAAVFVRREAVLRGPLVDPAPERFSDLRNAEVAQRVFTFAAEAADYRTAWIVLRQLETRLADRADRAELTRARTYRDAHRALREREYGHARSLFDGAFKERIPGDQDRLIMVFLDRLAKSKISGNEREAQGYETALAKLVAPEP